MGESLKKLLDKDMRPILFYVMFFIFILGFSFAGLAYDFDYWARISVGKFFMQTGMVPKHDFFSYTPTHMWYDHEWGSGVVFYIINKLFSHTGTVILSAILVFLIFFFMSKTIKLRGVKTTHPYNFMYYFFAFITINYIVDQLIRCQLFSFMFFSIFLYCLELARKGNNKGLYTLPFLMLIWNNLHGGCAAGLGLIVIYAIGELLNKRSIRKYVVTFLFTFFVLPINPWGWDYLGFFISANTMNRAGIIEWYSLLSPQFGQYDYIEFLIYVFILFSTDLVITVKEIRSKTFVLDKTKYLALALILFESIKHIKLIPLGVITTGVFMYDNFYTVFNTITFNSVIKYAKIKDLMIYCIILIFAIVNINPSRFKPFLDWEKFPIKAVEFIKINHLEGNLLVNYGLGSFVGYKLYPHNKTFIDGRYEEVYDDYLLHVLFNYYELGRTWDKPLKEYPTKLVLAEKKYGVYNALLNEPGWAQIYSDESYAIFTKTNEVRKEYILPPTNLEYYQDHIFDTDMDFRGKKWQKK